MSPQLLKVAERAMAVLGKRLGRQSTTTATANGAACYSAKYLRYDSSCEARMA